MWFYSSRKAQSEGSIVCNVTERKRKKVGQRKEKRHPTRFSNTEAIKAALALTTGKAEQGCRRRESGR